MVYLVAATVVFFRWFAQDDAPAAELAGRSLQSTQEVLHG